MNIALIPARSGSKGIPRKNIKLLGSFPLIAYSIAAARLCKEIGWVVVSTESQEIAETAQYYGASIPFMRPEELALDTSTALDYMKHAIGWLYNNNYKVELIIQLLPTTPLRDPDILSTAIKGFDRGYTSLRSAHELAEPPQKMMQVEYGCFTGFFPDDHRPEYFNLPRQTFPKAYHPNGYIEIIRPGIVSNCDVLFGSMIMPFITPYTIEVDQPEDFEYLEYLIEKRGHPLLDYLKSGIWKLK